MIGTTRLHRALTQQLCGVGCPAVGGVDSEARPPALICRLCHVQATLGQIPRAFMPPSTVGIMDYLLHVAVVRTESQFRYRVKSETVGTEHMLSLLPSQPCSFCAWETECLASTMSWPHTGPAHPSGPCPKLTSSRRLSGLGRPGHRLTLHFHFAFQTLFSNDD